MQNYEGDFAGSQASYRRAIAQAEATVRQFPDDPSRLVSLSTILVEFALTLSDRFRQGDLEEAAACARRAAAVNDLIPATAHAGRRPRWDLLLMQAVIEDARWNGDVDRGWQEVEAALPADLKPVTDYEKDEVVSACNGLARWHLARGRHEAAAGWLARARERIEADPAVVSKRAVETGWLEARLAAAHGDHESAAAGADRILAVRTTWLAKRRAADCLHLAWRCATTASATAASAADAYRERAAWYYAEVLQALRDDVAKDPLDPWYVLPWGFASVRAAELANAAGDAARALELLSPALPKLEGVRAEAHADQWDEAVLRDGRELEQRLAAAAGR
jgi:tetratricopeptide (TPR) repeat protein